MDKQELYKEVEDLDKFCLGIRKYVALNEVMYLVKQLDEPQKVVIPQCVASWIEYCKNTFFSLARALAVSEEDFHNYANQKDHLDLLYFLGSMVNQETFAKAWINGYEIKKEKHYKIKIIKTDQYLYKNGKDLFFSSYSRPEYNPRIVFTKEELEQENSDWVFDCPGIEVEEVKE